jgi:hypothetical protein
VIEYSRSMINNDQPAKIKLPFFELQSGETVLYQTIGHRSWYAIGWKVIGGLITIVLLTVISWFIFSEPATGLLLNILPTAAVSVLTQILCLGLVPLLIAAWVTEDVARTIVGRYVLTDKRLWVRGSPYAWNSTETPLDDIDSLTFRRDAVFIRRKSDRKIIVHMLPDGKLLAKVYKDFLAKTK